MLAAGAALGASGAHEHLTPERLRGTLEGLGPAGPLIFVVAFAVLEPLHVPGILFILTAPLVWPLPAAFALSLCGATGAGIVGFVGARYLAHDAVQRHLPASWRAWDDRLASHGFRTVVVIRLLTFLAPAAHWGIGLSSVRFGPAVVGTAVGLAPGLLLLTWLGDHVVAWFAELPAAAWIGLVGVAAAALVFRWWRRLPRQGEAAGQP